MINPKCKMARDISRKPFTKIPNSTNTGNRYSSKIAIIIITVPSSWLPKVDRDHRVALLKFKRQLSNRRKINLIIYQAQCRKYR